MRRLLLVTMLAILVISGLTALASEPKQTVLPERSEAIEAERFGISLTTDKATHAPGDTIALKLKVFNYTEENVTLHFSSVQRYDFAIEDEKGKEVWRWSDGRMFAQVLEEETLGPNRNEITYSAKYEGKPRTEVVQGKLKPGFYKITELLVAKDRPMSGRIEVKVR